MKSTLLERNRLYPGFLSRHYDEPRNSHSTQMPKKRLSLVVFRCVPSIIKGSYLEKAVPFRLYLCFHGRDSSETVHWAHCRTGGPSFKYPAFHHACPIPFIIFFAFLLWWSALYLGNQNDLVCISASMGGTFPKLHTAHRRRIRCNLCTFRCFPSVIAGTLLGARSNVSSAFRLKPHYKFYIRL